LDYATGLPQNYSWNFGEGAKNVTDTVGLGPFVISYSIHGSKEIAVYYTHNNIRMREASREVFVSELINNDLIPNVKFESFAAHRLILHAEIKPMSNSVSAARPSEFEYKWTITSADYPNIIVVEKQTDEREVPGDGKYKVELVVTDRAGCSITWETEVTTEAKFRAPNIFTPNDDGKNDTFIVESDGIRKLKIEIYDRWGAIVFRQGYFTTQIVWDGRNTTGNLVKPGVYFYVVELEDDKTEPLKGFVHVHY
jgi:gliding motility-associated-like protein